MGNQMTRVERIKAALYSQEVDRVPVDVWQHFSVEDQDPRSLAERQVAYTKKFDYDFIKLMPFGLYGVQDYGAKIKIFNQIEQPPIVEDGGIHDISDWGRLEVLPAYYGTYGKQIQMVQYVNKLTKGELPYIQTVFSPLTNARKLAGDRILTDMKENPVLFKQALQVLTDTTINFIKANIEAGVSGFFFAPQCATTNFMTEEEYKEFGVPYDLQVINAYKDVTWFNVAHIHGDNGMFDLIEKYPVQCLSWHDRWGEPSLQEARTRTNKAFLAGIREIPYFRNGKKIRESLLVDGSIPEVKLHVFEALDQVDGKGILIGPGCVASQFSTDSNLHAVRSAVADYAVGNVGAKKIYPKAGVQNVPVFA